MSEGSFPVNGTSVLDEPGEHAPLVSDGDHGRLPLGSASSPRVLVLLNTNAAWSRGIVRGLITAARELGWTLLQHHPSDDVSWLIQAWTPAAIVIGPGQDLRALGDRSMVVSAAADRTADGIASVCVDEQAIARLAADHLLATGLRNMAVFRRWEYDFALEREAAFLARVSSAGVRVAPGCRFEGPRANREDDYAPVLAWLRGLPKPCGVFACTDFWGKGVALCARAAGIRIPEDVAIVGVDNDTLQCELVVPPLSSVLVPWRELGETTAKVVHGMIERRPQKSSRGVVSPLAVLRRRSSDVLAIQDELVANAVRFIREHVTQRVNLDMIANAVGSGRQRLERRFRRSLDRTIQDEVRRSRVDVARRFLETTDGDLREVARHSGFTNATLLNLAFQRELGMAPGAYRRRVRQEVLELDVE
ncbi:MAG TPA: substrate-binding domain-containing protein [Polyangiaceae bacterium]